MVSDNDDNFIDDGFGEEKTNSVSGNGIGLEDKPTLSKIWDPEQVLRLLELTWKGYNQQDDGTWVQDGKNAIARDEIIETVVNNARTLVNSPMMIGKMLPEDIEMILLEKIKEEIFLFHDEFSVDEDMIETMVNQIDHIQETFMKGIIEKGHGSNTLTQVYAGLHEGRNEESYKKNFFDKIAEKLDGDYKR